MSTKRPSSTKRTFKIGAMSLLWLANPVLVGGCGEKGFEFEAEDMVALAETIEDSSWTANIEGQDYEMEFMISSESIEDGLSQLNLQLGSALACENRSFLGSAAACIDTTELRVDGFLTVTKEDSNFVVIDNVPIEGIMSVRGRSLNNAELRFFIGDGESVHFDSADGIAFEMGIVNLNVSE